MTEELDQIQDELLDQVHAGQPIDREAVLRAHPQHAEALAAFLDLLDVVEGESDASLPPTSLGEYRVIREIGRGGMGIVYEAEQTSLKRPVALKILPPSLRMDTRLVHRFQREAEAAGRLHHPNIVPVFAVGEAADAPFFAMEYVPGQTLRDVIRLRKEGESAGLSTDPDTYRRWAVETCVQVADALTYAHRDGIVHRDVKPGNILLGEDWTPRLTDFGLARDLRSPGLSLTGEVLGSPQYMSPEQAIRHDHPVDERTDVYSLAVTLYQLLTLDLPYAASTHAELLTALAAGRIVPARRRDPTLPKAIDQVLLRALEADPKDRYPSAALFAADLRGALAGRSPARLARAWIKPLAASLVLAVASAVAVGLLVRARHRTEQTPVREEQAEERQAQAADDAGAPTQAAPSLGDQAFEALWEKYQRQRPRPGKPSQGTLPDYEIYIVQLRKLATSIDSRKRSAILSALWEVYADFVAGPGAEDPDARAFLGHRRYEHELPEAISQRNHAFLRAVEWASEKRWFTSEEKTEYALAREAWTLTEQHLERLVHDEDFNKGDRAAASIMTDRSLRRLILRTHWESPYLICHASKTATSPFDALREADPRIRRAEIERLSALDKRVQADLAATANTLHQLRAEYLRRYQKKLRLTPLMSPWGGRPGNVDQGRSYRDGVPLTVVILNTDELFDERLGRGIGEAGRRGFHPRSGSIYLSGEAQRDPASPAALLDAGTRQLEYWFARQRNNWKKPVPTQDYFRTGFPAYLAGARADEDGLLTFGVPNSRYLSNMQDLNKTLHPRGGTYPLFSLRELIGTIGFSTVGRRGAAMWGLSHSLVVSAYIQQCWALIYFLNTAQDGKYQGAFDRLHDLVLHRDSRHRVYTDEFREVFRIMDDEEWLELENEFHTYVRDTLLKMEQK